MEFPVRIPFVESLGFELIGWNGDEAQIAVEVRDELCNSWNVAHGGVTMTLLDVVMAHASRRTEPGGLVHSSGVVTIEMKTTFMRPGIGRLLGTGRVLHRTTQMTFCEASVHDAEGKLVAHATGTFKALKGLPVGGRLIQRNDASD
ncbi:MAG: PaaI family thioesterase [Pseudomonadota bacterium]|nr:PaaI family thioesterase [Pseudomonadota bacterium]